MVKSQTGKGNENRGESFITFKERKFGEGDNHPKKFRKLTCLNIEFSRVDGIFYEVVRMDKIWFEQMFAASFFGFQ